MKNMKFIAVAAGSLLMLPALLSAQTSETVTLIPEVPGGQPGFGGGYTGGYAPAAVDAKLNVNIADDVHTVEFIRDNVDPYTVTKAYEIKNANPYAVRGYLLNVVNAKSLRGSPVQVDALKFNDGTALVIVSAEEYRFTDSMTGEGIDTIIAKLDKKGLSYGGNTNSFIYFPKANTAAGLKDMIANVGASMSDNEFGNGIDTLRVDSGLNALVVSAPMWSWKNVAKMLAAYDNPAPEVRISYKVYEVYAENDDKIGIDFQSWKNNDGVDLFATGARARRNWSTLFTGSPTHNHENNSRYINFQPKWNTRYLDFMTAHGHAKLMQSGVLVAKNREVSKFNMNYGYFHDQTDVNIDNATGTASMNYMKPNVDVIPRQAITDIIPESLLKQLAPNLTASNNNWRVLYQLANDLSTYGDAEALKKSLDVTKYLQMGYTMEDINRMLVIATALNQVYWNKNPMNPADRSHGYMTSNAMAGIIHGKLQIPMPSSGFKLEMQVQPVVTQKATQLDFIFSGVSLIGWNSDGSPRTSKSDANTRIQLTNGPQEFVVSDIQKVEIVRGIAGLPILKDLPVLGWLFGDENESTKKTRIVITLRAEYANPNDAMPAEVRKNVGKIMDDLEKGWRSPVNNVGFQQLLLDTDEWK